MAKIYQILAIFVIIAGAIFFWILHERKSAKNEIIVEKQGQEIEHKKQEIKKAHEIIETKKNQQKLINKTSINIDIDSRREWLRLIFEERAAAEIN